MRKCREREEGVILWCTEYDARAKKGTPSLFTKRIQHLPQEFQEKEIRFINPNYFIKLSRTIYRYIYKSALVYVNVIFNWGGSEGAQAVIAYAHTLLGKWQTLWLCQPCIMVSHAGDCRCYIKYACRMPHAACRPMPRAGQLPSSFHLHMALFLPSPSSHTHTHIRFVPLSLCVCWIDFWCVSRKLRTISFSFDSTRVIGIFD